VASFSDFGALNKPYDLTAAKIIQLIHYLNVAKSQVSIMAAWTFTKQDALLTFLPNRKLIM
jgi:hypothetical protein